MRGEYIAVTFYPSKSPQSVTRLFGYAIPSLASMFIVFSQTEHYSHPPRQSPLTQLYPYSRMLCSVMHTSILTYIVSCSHLFFF